MFPVLLAEVARSTTVVYDASSYVRPDDAIEALCAGSATLERLKNHYGKQHGRHKLHWALVIAFIEAHEHQPEPVRSFGNGVVNEHGRRLFGGEECAFDLYRKEGWTIWDTKHLLPRDCLQKEQSADGKWWYRTPLGSSRKILTHLRVRSSVWSCPSRHETLG